MVQPVCCIMVL